MHLSKRKFIYLKHLLKGLGETMCILTCRDDVHIGLEADKTFFIRYILITLPDMYSTFIF